MQLFDPKGFGAPGSGLFHAKEKRRLSWMLIGALLLIGAIVAIRAQVGKNGQPRSPEQARAPTLPTEISLPKIDVAALEAAAHDGSAEPRVSLLASAIEAGFAACAQLSDSVFDALGGRELTPQIAEQILEAPTQHRGQLLRVRCSVDEIHELENPADNGKPRRLVRGHLEAGTQLFFAVEESVGVAPAPGDFVRIDGLFVRVEPAEIEGVPPEVPLFVGPRMFESFRALTPVRQLDANAFHRVHDDSVADGLEGLDQDAYWQLVSYVKHLEQDAVDWDKAPILDNKTIQSIFSDGNAWRGKPVRVPAARLLDVWKKAQSENPLRLEHLIEGWFGRGDWIGQAKLAHFVAPFDAVPANLHGDVSVRAFFYKNLAYAPRDGGTAIAPFFVVQSLERCVPADNPGLRQLGYVLAATLLILGVAIFVALRKDRKSSAALEAQLRRWRHERRQKLSPGAKT